MNAGRMDRRITIQRLVEGAPTSSGDVTLTPQDVATVWAEVLSESGTEMFRNDQKQGWSTMLFRTRYMLDGAQVPTVKHRISYAGRLYDILDVREINRREGWEYVGRARSEDRP